MLSKLSTVHIIALTIVLLILVGCIPIFLWSVFAPPLGLPTLTWYEVLALFVFINWSKWSK